MSLFKKISTLVLSMAMVGQVFLTNASALHGNTHYFLAESALNSSGISISESERSYFLSGAVYAKIGLMKFDKEAKVKSNSKKFINQMKKFAKTPEEKWFVKGFEANRFQEKNSKGKFKKFLARLNDSHLGKKCSERDNIIKGCLCSMIDKYFEIVKNKFIYTKLIEKFNPLIVAKFTKDKLGTMGFIPDYRYYERIGDKCKKILKDRYNETEEKAEIKLCSDLLKKTYKHFGLEVTDEDIENEAGNLIGSYAVATKWLAQGCFDNDDDFTEEMISCIKSDSEKIYKEYAKILKSEN